MSADDCLNATTTPQGSLTATRLAARLVLLKSSLPFFVSFGWLSNGLLIFVLCTYRLSTVLLRKLLRACRLLACEATLFCGETFGFRLLAYGTGLQVYFQPIFQVILACWRWWKSQTEKDRRGKEGE